VTTAIKSAFAPMKPSRPVELRPAEPKPADPDPEQIKQCQNPPKAKLTLEGGQLVIAQGKQTLSLNIAELNTAEDLLSFAMFLTFIGSVRKEVIRAAVRRVAQEKHIKVERYDASTGKVVLWSEYRKNAKAPELNP
jgi:hypothetical protein